MEVGGIRTLEQDAFLRLLITQLQYQDPLSPMKNVEFITQLTQFSQLEQTTSMNKTLQDSVQQLGSLGYYSAAGLIGKEVQAEGRTIPLVEGTSTTLSYRLSKDASNVAVLITDPAGEPIRVMKPGPQKEGRYNIQWDGQDDQGRPVPSGLYFYDVAAVDDFGVGIGSTTFTRGQITGVTFEEGMVYLMVNGEKLPAADAVKISERAGG